LTANVLGIVCALAAEARHLRPTPLRRAPFASLADGTLVAVSGMGAAAAGLSACALIEAGAGALASFGLAGGLDPALEAGSLFLPSEVITLCGPGIYTARGWRERLGTALAAQRPATHGKLLSSPRAIGSVAEKAALFRDTGAAAVDMESMAVAQAAEARQLPFIALRVIIDSARDELPRAVRMAADGAGQLQLWGLLGALACSPAQLAPLMRLAWRYRSASRSMAAVARAGSMAAYAFS
jgi:adenosylhomocysteine nucleosidase